MKKIEKLFKKISKVDRGRLLNIIETLISKDISSFNIKKVTDTDFFRLKSGRFRIIFHYEKKVLIIDSIKIRNEKTYKRL